MHSSAERDDDPRPEIEALRAAEQKYRTVLDSVGVVVWQADPATFDLLYVSRTIERNLGYTVEEALRPGFWPNMIIPDDRQWAVAVCKRQVELRQSHTIEYRACAKDGSIRWIRDIITVRDCDGATELYGVFVDITETKLEEDRRRYEHSLLHTSLQASPIGEAILGRDGAVVIENARLREMRGDTALQEWLTHTDLLDAESCLKRADAEATEAREWETRDGRVIESRAVPVCGADDEYYGHLVLFRDITGDRRREEELREREEHFRSLIEHASDVISVLAPDGTIYYKSPGVERVLGYTPEEMLGRDAFDHVIEEDRPLAHEVMRGLMKTGKPQEVELRVRHKNGSTRWMSIVFSQVTTGKQTRVVLNSRDITERKALEASLAQAERMTSLGHMAATIAHEMNNVLMAINANVDVLSRLAPSEPNVQRTVKHIAESVRRGRRATEEILRFTKPPEPRLRPLEIGRWLRDVIAEIEPMLGKGVDVSLEIPDLPLNIMGDAEALTQALTNVLLNARDAMSGKGRVSISVQSDASTWASYGGPFDRFAHISVRDEGPGMPRHVVERMFEPLFTTKERGTGLGLTVVHQVITAHGGLIHVESAEGMGTTFHLFLPRTNATEVVLPPSSPTIPQALRVLLVEDEPLVAEGLAYVLSLEGANVRVVERGEQVITAANEFRPAVVLLDVGLPDIPGTEVFARLRERWPLLPVIFSTGHADAGRLEKLLNPPLVDVALKPYDCSSILMKIHDAIQTAPTRS